MSVSRGGIPKHAVELGRVGELGIEGDSCRNRKYHGGPMQALLLITSEGLEELRALGFPLFAGSLGENLTTRGLDRRSMRIGQRYRSGSVEIELTKLRVPCSTLDPYGRGVQKALY
ncbi:MAG TPA: MOSC domain-containing protein, partial [Bryobacteraceae bacterium]|nr:MOSC domain-containing protein [Bryobacteraceae bacterium]